MDHVALSADGRRVLSCSFLGDVALWDVKSAAAIGEPLRPHVYPLKSLAISADAQTAVLCSRKQLVAYSLSDGENRWRYSVVTLPNMLLDEKFVVGAVTNSDKADADQSSSRSRATLVCMMQVKCDGKLSHQPVPFDVILPNSLALHVDDFWALVNA